MDAESFKYIGVGLMAFGMMGAAIGVGNIFSALINGIARNPSAESKLFGRAILGAALAESLGVAAVGIGLMLMYK